MSILKNNLRLSGSSVQSDARSTNSKVINRVCATFLAGLILFGGAKAQNVLVNPGAETGDLTGWNVSLTGYIYTVSTNGTIPNSGTSNFLAHSGKWTFQLFDTTSDSAFIYQDYAAVAGSQWSASCYALCYASNYFIAGANAHMQVVFYGMTNNVVVSTNSSSGTAGIYGSDFLDPQDLSGIGVYWAIVPPLAVDASGWVFLTPTNLYAPAPLPVPPDRATEAYFEVPNSPITTTLTAPANTPSWLEAAWRFPSATLTNTRRLAGDSKVVSDVTSTRRSASSCNSTTITSASRAPPSPTRSTSTTTAPRHK